MIVSTGIDIERIARIEQLINAHAGRLLDIFSPAEIDFSERQKKRAAGFAACFAGKEAVMKALGTGWHTDVPWKDIEILWDGSKTFNVKLSAAVEPLATKQSIDRIMVSISLTDELVVASAIALGNENKGN